MSDQLDPPPVFTDFIVFYVGHLKKVPSQLHIAAVSSYQAKLVAQQKWTLPNTCDLEIALATKDGKPSGKVVLI